MGVVDVKQTGEHELALEWESSASNDMVADSTLALITGIDRSPASAKREHFLSHVPFYYSVPPDDPPHPILSRGKSVDLRTHCTRMLTTNNRFAAVPVQ